MVSHNHTTTDTLVAAAHVCVEEGVILVLLPPVERALTPPLHDGHHVVHVGLGLSHSLLQVTDTITSRLDVLPHSWTDSRDYGSRAHSNE